jgi:hypothetical protein
MTEPPAAASGIRSSASANCVAFVATPHHVHRLLERRRGWHLGFEVAEEGALDAHDAAEARQRLLAHQQQDIARPSESSAEKRPDAADAEHGVPHHRVESTALDP